MNLKHAIKNGDSIKCFVATAVQLFSEANSNPISLGFVQMKALENIVIYRL